MKYLKPPQLAHPERLCTALIRTCSVQCTSGQPGGSPHGIQMRLHLEHILSVGARPASEDLYELRMESAPGAGGLPHHIRRFKEIADLVTRPTARGNRVPDHGGVLAIGEGEGKPQVIAKPWN